MNYGDIYPENDTSTQMELSGTSSKYHHSNSSPNEVSTALSQQSRSTYAESLEEVDDFDDSKSILSDVHSVSSSGKSSLKRALATVNKLKRENMVLRDALDKANVSDITMLKTKLRGSHADIVRYKQNASEMRDRIQTLEGKLFAALNTDRSGSSGSSNTVGEEARSKTVQRQKEFEMQIKVGHLSKLCLAYEKKMAIMQAELEREKTFNRIPPVARIEMQSSNGSAEGKQRTRKLTIQEEPAADKIENNNCNIPSSQLELLRKQCETLQTASKVDQKTIVELAAEVKRLAALVHAHTQSGTETEIEMDVKFESSKALGDGRRREDGSGVAGNSRSSRSVVGEVYRRASQRARAAEAVAVASSRGEEDDGHRDSHRKKAKHGVVVTLCYCTVCIFVALLSIFVLVGLVSS